METTRKLWGNLGVVDTIYEEEDTERDSADEHTTASISPVISPSPTSLRSRSVLLPCMASASGHENKVVIHVQGSSFRVKKGPLIANSSYFKRLLMHDHHHPSSKDLTISPPLKITPETFSLVIQYCSGSQILITPFNVAPLRVAAELLEMTEEVNDGPGEDLRKETENYLRRVVAVNKEYTGIVLQSCVPLIPEAETTASLVSRCIEALSVMNVEEEEGVLRYLEDFADLPADNFRVVVESLNQRLSSHDILYRLVDFYFKGHIGEITDEEKVKMCNYIDCTILSPQLLMHAVQNPRMPLRFVVQAMFLEQLNTRRTIFDQHHDVKQLNTRHKEKSSNPHTLGGIFQRDAALRQMAQLKANMDSTRDKVQTLEKELVEMRRLLHESENKRKNTQNAAAARSQSFRTVSLNQMNKIERDQIGSVSSESLSVLPSKERGVVSTIWSPPSPLEEEDARGGTGADQKNLGRRLMNGLKSAFFRVPNSMYKKKKKSNGETKNTGDVRNKIGNRGDEYDDVAVVIKKDLAIRGRPGKGSLQSRSNV